MQSFLVDMGAPSSQEENVESQSDWATEWSNRLLQSMREPATEHARVQKVSFTLSHS